MKTLPTVALACLCIYLCACGDTGKSARLRDQIASTSAGTAASAAPSDTTPAPVETNSDRDHDNDGASGDDKNNNSLLDYGQAAAPSETRKIEALVKHYYAVALSENGSAACSMIYSTLAESVPEDYGQSPSGAPYMRGATCPTVITLLFKHFHPQISLEYPTLKVAHVRLVEHHGLALITFGKLPERQIPIRREGHTWKISALLDSALP